jgi:iron(III) transport system substrate-binding protein
VPCEGAGYEVSAMSIIHGTPRIDGAKRFYDWALGVSAQRIGGEMKYFHVPSNKATPVPGVAPNWSAVKLVPIDFARFDSAVEQRRLLERWDREVHAAPR